MLLNSVPTAVCALLMVIILIGETVAGSTTVKLCYIYSTPVSDLGWSFSFNRGRLQAHQDLSAKYPSITFESLYRENMFAVPLVNRSTVALGLIQRGCRVLFTNDQSLLSGLDDWFAATYANVSFVLLNDAKFFNVMYPNRVYTGFAVAPGYYLGGVAAGMHAKSRICFSAAWKQFRNPKDAVNGFLLGVRSVNPTIPIDVVTMNNWGNGAGEVELGKVFLNMSCDVIGRYSNPRDMDQYIARAGGGRVLTVSPHSNLQDYVGDSVLLAVYSNWAPRIVEIVSDVLSTGNPDQSKIPYNFGLSDNALSITPVSALVGSAIRSTIDSMRVSKFGATDQVFCGNLTLANGSAVQYAAGSNCQSAAVALTMFVDVGQRDHGIFPLASDCGAGNFSSYVVDPIIRLVCTPCPANTFSTAAGSTSCTPCRAGYVSGRGAVVCETAPQGFPKGAIAGIVVPLVVLLLVAAGFVVQARQATAVKNKTAPKEPPLCLLFTDVESSTNQWQMYPDAMKVAMEIHHSSIRECIAEYGAYEVKTVGDSFMIAVQSTMDGLLLALAIQRKLYAVEWPREFQYDPPENQLWNGLKVRIGVHHCTDVEPKYEALRQYYDYYGNDVNISSRVESSARGGQVLVDAETIAVIRDDPDFEGLVEEDNVISLFAKGVELKGVDGTFSLFSVLPKEFIGRKFEPLPGQENLDQMESGRETDSFSQSETASQGSRNGGALAISGVTRRLQQFLEKALQDCPAADKKKALEILCKAHKITTQSQPRQIHALVKLCSTRIPKQAADVPALLGELSASRSVDASNEDSH